MNNLELDKNMDRLPTHPGEVIKEELESRFISQKDFARILEVPYTRMNEVLNCKRPVTCELALLVESALGISAELLMSMQNRYNMAQARKKKALLDRLSAVRNACAAL